MSLNNAGNFRAGGTVPPSRFVKINTSADHEVLVNAAATTRSIGISQEGMKRPPGVTGSDDTIAAESGDNVQVYGLGDVCLLTAGTGGWTRGDLLVSDSTGRGVTGTTGQEAGAVALENASAANVKALVQIVNRLV